MDTNAERRERPHGLVVPLTRLMYARPCASATVHCMIGSGVPVTCVGHSLVHDQQGADVHSTTASYTTMTWAMTQP
jgi:hypothetical protein